MKFSALSIISAINLFVLCGSVAPSYASGGDKYEVYNSSIAETVEYKSGDNLVEISLNRVGAAKTALVKSVHKSGDTIDSTTSNNKEVEKEIEYYPNGSVKSEHNLGTKDKITFAVNGVLSDTANIKPFLGKSSTVLELVYGVRESGTTNLYPVKVGEHSFNSQHLITGEYYFYGANPGKGPILKVIFSDGVIDGRLEGYYESGATKIEATLVKGILDGAYVRYDETPIGGVKNSKGKFIRERGVYRSGVLDGNVIGYKDGSKWFDLVLSRGVLNGPVTMYASNGAILEECQFKNNIRIGNCKLYIEKGTLVVDGNFGDGRRDGMWQEWYQNGATKKIANYKQGRLDGQVLTYAPNGLLQKSEQYKDNKLHGLARHYDDKGKLKATADYKDNKREGMVTTYYSSGQVEFQVQFVNDHKHGVQKRFYETGELYEITEFSHGRQVGLSQSFFKTGVSMGGSL